MKKLIRNVLLVLLVLILGFFLLFKFCTPFRNTVIKEASRWRFVRDLVGKEVEDDYENKMVDGNFDSINHTVNDGVAGKLTGYTNIALFGIDSRATDEFEDGIRSDSIIVVSINNDTNSVKMVSVYRDTMLKITDDNDKVQYSKANHAFFKGGANCAVSMLNNNLDLDISEYIVVNFAGLTEIIDKLGGLTLDIREEEIKYINNYIEETSKIAGVKSEKIRKAGEQKVDGVQATAYCRIRYTPFYDEEGKKYSDDLGRTARQRLVLEKMVKKAKKLGMSELVDLVKEIMNMNTEDSTFIKTSLRYNEVMDLVPVLIDYDIKDAAGFPFTLTAPTIKGTSYVVAQGLSYNVQELHKFLFEEEDYEVSKEVEKISKYIRNYTGVKEVHLKEETESEE